MGRALADALAALRLIVWGLPHGFAAAFGLSKAPLPSRPPGSSELPGLNQRILKELQLELRPEARTLGRTVEDLARQARAAF